jgi:MYXO-CTERM domain-containing protein
MTPRLRVLRTFTTVLAGCLSIPLVATPASAQSLRPNMLFIVDTSGSMQENAGGTWVGENTNICPGPTTSKMYGLKAAMRAALAQVGTDEANLGLMSFPLRVVANPSGFPACRSSGGMTGRVGHYEPTPQIGGRNLGCDITTHTTGQTTFGAWFTTGVPEVIRVGVTTAAAGVTPTAANYDPVDANIPAIYKWIDNVELPLSSAAVTDPELHGMSYTPLGRSLFYSRMYFDNFVKPQDPKGSCRVNVVVLVTDGEEYCDTTAPNNTFSLANCTGGGTTYSTFHPVAQACQLYRTSNIKTYVVTDNGLSASELAANDAIARAGGTSAAIRVSLANSDQAKAAIVGIIAETVPPTEVCNGLDDNCNGQIDEGVSNMCAFNATTLAHCRVESANCMDDNCNGVVDEGFPPNACGQPAGCPIPPERCDGLDNDCDGDIDEGFDVGAACDNGLTGACRRIGIKVCTADGAGTTCDITGAPVGTEVCNGVDDDCNGMVDDGMLPGVGITCGIQLAGCMSGITRCIAGKIVCDSTSNPQPEMCNGRDDDCNGLVDDGTFPEVGKACVCPGLPLDRVGVGLCKGGITVCAGVDGFQCQGCVLPQPEICDGKDNDCDGQADQEAMCPSGFGCREGACTLLCRPGEFPCPPGYECKNNFCVPNRCRNVTCGTDEKCDNDTGSCVELCYKVTCQSGQTCVRGQCLDCSNSDMFACPAGQRCVNRNCLADPCAGVTCGVDQYCSNGDCVSLTCGGGCPKDQKCIGGTCRMYMCETVACPSPLTQYCDFNDGMCKPNLCASKTCPPTACAKETGECMADPCGNIDCPHDGCWSCALTPAGEPYCSLRQDCQYVRALTGNTGGGCACSTAETSPSGVSLAAAALLAGAALLGRRRRRARRRVRC